MVWYTWPLYAECMTSGCLSIDELVRRRACVDAARIYYAVVVDACVQTDPEPRGVGKSATPPDRHKRVALRERQSETGPHKLVKEPDEEIIPTASMDYMRMQSEDGRRGNGS